MIYIDEKFFTVGIFVYWHFYQWHFCYLVFLQMAFLFYGIFTNGIFVVWHYYQRHFCTMAFLPMAFLNHGIVTHWPLVGVLRRLLVHVIGLPIIIGIACTRSRRNTPTSLSALQEASVPTCIFEIIQAVVVNENVN